jgi:hypothetical protein
MTMVSLLYSPWKIRESKTLDRQAFHSHSSNEWPDKKILEACNFFDIARRQGDKASPMLWTFPSTFLFTCQRQSNCWQFGKVAFAAFFETKLPIGRPGVDVDASNLFESVHCPFKVILMFTA